MYKRQVLKREKERQGFYRDLPERLESIDDLKTLPFTTESDLAQKGGRMLLCSQGEIQRIISEQTSGTTGAGKRVFYTEGDCEHTIELFMAGLGEFIQLYFVYCFPCNICNFFLPTDHCIYIGSFHFLYKYIPFRLVRLYAQNGTIP